MAALRDTYRDGPWEKPNAWRGSLKDLGVAVDRPPRWLDVPLLARGRAGEATRGVVRDEYAQAARQAMTREYLTGDPLRGDRYAAWRGDGSRSSTGSPATVALKGIDPNDTKSMSLVVAKLQKLLIHEQQLELKRMMRTALPLGVTDPGLGRALEKSMAPADLQRELTGTRCEMAEVSAFLRQSLGLDAKALSGDPVKIVAASQEVLDARSSRETSLLESGAVLDRGMKALDDRVRSIVAGGDGHSGAAANGNAASVAGGKSADGAEPGGDGSARSDGKGKGERRGRFGAVAKGMVVAGETAIAESMAVVAHMHKFGAELV